MFEIMPTRARQSLDPALAAALARAAAAIARLDQALAAHPLLPAFLHRARLDAVRRQAAADGRLSISAAECGLQQSAAHR